MVVHALTHKEPAASDGVLELEMLGRFVHQAEERGQL